MYLLYLDESGNDPKLPWFVLAGVSVPERQTHWIEQDLNEIATRFDGEDPHAVELHGNPMHKGNGRWRRVPQEVRERAITDALDKAVKQRHAHGVRLFAAVIRREKVPPEQTPVGVAFEQISSRFDYMLTRLNDKNGTRRPSRRGLILFDKAGNELTIQSIAREFKYTGHQWGRTRNYAEVPVFLDSASSRLIQLADLVSCATYQHFAQQNPIYFQTISRCFDADGPREHGLYVLS